MSELSHLLHRNLSSLSVCCLTQFAARVYFTLVSYRASVSGGTQRVVAASETMVVMWASFGWMRLNPHTPLSDASGACSIMYALHGCFLLFRLSVTEFIS